MFVFIYQNRFMLPYSNLIIVDNKLCILWLFIIVSSSMPNRLQANSGYLSIFVRTFSWVTYFYFDISESMFISLRYIFYFGQLACFICLSQFKYMEHYHFAVWNTSIILLVWDICPITTNNNHQTTNSNHSITVQNSKHSCDP